MAGSPRIALFIPSLAGGGVERVMTVLAGGLADRGCRVDLVLAKAEGPLLNAVDSRVRIVDLDRRRVLFSIPPLVRYLRREKPDAVLSGIAHANLTAIIARWIARSKCRLVISVHNYLSGASRVSPHFLERIMPQLVKRFYPRADHVVAVSGDVARDTTTVTGLPAGFVSTIPNPVDLRYVAASSKDSVEHPFFRDGGGPVLVGVGRFVPEKGFDVLVRAMPRLIERKDARLVLLGEGPGRLKLGELAGELGIQDRIHLAGYVDNPFSYMAAADVVVVPSRWEGFGNVLVEAMACGTPVVATKCPGGPAEILGDGEFGPLAAVDDPEALAEAIVSALERPVAASTLRVRAEEFAMDRVVERYLEVILGSQA